MDEDSGVRPWRPDGGVDCVRIGGSGGSLAGRFRDAGGSATYGFGLQTEYDGRGILYENAHFLDDTFSFTTTDINHHSTTVNIAYANRL